MIGLFTTEFIRREAHWKGLDDAEFPTLDWVYRYNKKRLVEPIGHIPPSEFEQRDYQNQPSAIIEAVLN